MDPRAMFWFVRAIDGLVSIEDSWCGDGGVKGIGVTTAGGTGDKRFI